MKRFFLYFALIALLPGLSTKAGHLYAAGAKQQSVVAQKAAAPNPADYVGSDVCATCHADIAKKFGDNPHQKLALRNHGTGATCESCHGPGKAHVEGGGDVTKIKQLAKLTPKEIDATCLGCHAGTHPNFERSPHAKAGVSCTSCHSIHAAGSEGLLKVSQPNLCFQCHADVKPAFAMPFHHKVNEGLIKCSDCHDVHGTFGNNNIKSTADQNDICTKCHAEVRGPFVFEHAAVKGERGCVGCHSPHGSQNPRLLNMANINQLCNQCHSPVSGSTVHGMNAGSAERQPCINCHTFIHGSNINPAFLR